MYVKRNTKERLWNHCCRGKAVSITHSNGLSVASLVPAYFSRLSLKRHDFRRNVDVDAAENRKIAFSACNRTVFFAVHPAA
jgi:hypothetical protein